MARHRTDELDRINSRYELTFDLGGVAGPLMLGGLMIWGGKVVPHIIIPAGFVLSAAFYLFIPERKGGEAVTGDCMDTFPGMDICRPAVPGLGSSTS